MTGNEGGTGPDNTGGTGNGGNNGSGTTNPAGGAGTSTAGGAPPNGSVNDKGFPDNVAPAQMTAEQQAAYWKHWSRTWEGRATSNSAALSELPQLREKAKRFDEAQAANQTDLERAQAEAAQLRADNEKYRLKELREGAARAAGLDVDDAQWITADTAETAKTQAEALAARLGVTTNNGQPGTGQPGSGQQGAAQQGAGPGGGTGFQQGYQGGRQAGTSGSVAAGRDLYEAKKAKRNPPAEART